MQQSQPREWEFSNAHLIEHDIWHSLAGDKESQTTTKGDGKGKGGGVSADDIAAGMESTAIILASLSPYMKRDDAKKAMKQEMRAACGKKPMFGKASRAYYFNCQKNYLAKKRASLQSQIDTPIERLERRDEKKFRVHPAVWIGGGLAVAGLVTFIIIRSRKKG